jgi:hypothetical protein
MSSSSELRLGTIIHENKELTFSLEILMNWFYFYKEGLTFLTDSAGSGKTTRLK